VLVVAEELSFSRAAERLHISQPGLSAQVRALEVEIGFAVFDRSTRRVALTPAGSAFVAEARRVADETDRLMRFVRLTRRQETTQLIVGTAIYTIDFRDRIELLERLEEACPDLHVQIETGVTQTELVTALADGHVDLAILMGVPVATEEYRRAVQNRAGRESVFDAGLRSVLLRRHPVGLLVPEESPLARRKQIIARALAGERVALFHAGHGHALYQPIANYLADAGAEVIIPAEPNAIGVERHGRRFRIPAITLGWFPQPVEAPGMVRREFADFDLATELVFAAQPDVRRPALERALEVARSLAAARRPTSTLTGSGAPSAR
jgi:DNA-binding transcriptional LysR family regulator